MTSLVSGQGTILAGVTEGGKTVLWGVSQLSAPNPVYSVYGQVDWRDKTDPDPKLVLTGRDISLTFTLLTSY